VTDAGTLTRAAAVDTQQIVASAWRDQAVWSETANRLKAELTRWRYIAAVAGVTGAFLETLAGTLASLGEPWRWLGASIALVGAVILAVVPVVLRTKASKERVQEWVRARSASEALKEEIYRYLVGAPPYGPGPAPAALIEGCQAVKHKVRDLAGHTARVERPSKERPLELTPNGYVDQRVTDQIEKYYRPQAKKNAIKAEKLHGLEFWLGVAAAGLGAVAGFTALPGIGLLPHLSPWVAVVTTAGAAVTAHLAAARYDHAAMIYTATADRLTALRDAWRADPNRLDPARVGKLVDDCENAISTENEAWLAEWTRQDS
jgi:SMODS and SLOG-associating 2TM effector domain 1/Protein of unknown function (DUF4231)